MKKTAIGWCVTRCDKDLDIFVPWIGYSQTKAIRNYFWSRRIDGSSSSLGHHETNHWRRMKYNGYRCRKVKIEWAD